MFGGVWRCLEKFGGIWGYLGVFGGVIIFLPFYQISNLFRHVFGWTADQHLFHARIGYM